MLGLALLKELRVPVVEHHTDGWKEIDRYIEPWPGPFNAPAGHRADLKMLLSHPQQKLEWPLLSNFSQTYESIGAHSLRSERWSICIMFSVSKWVIDKLVLIVAKLP